MDLQIQKISYHFNTTTMAQLNENLMKAIAFRTLKDLEILKEHHQVTPTEFCRLIGIPPSYITFLKKEDTYFKVPEWIWYLFQDFNSKKFEITNYGKLETHSRTMREIKSDCKHRSNKELIERGEKISASKKAREPKEETEIEFSDLPGMEIIKTDKGISNKDILDVLLKIVDLQLKQTYYTRDQWVEIKSSIRQLSEQ